MKGVGGEPPEPALFVTGFPRSGTTLLAELLSRHSRLCIPPETQFMEEFHDRLPGSIDPASSTGRRRIQFLVTRTRARDLGVRSEELLAALPDERRILPSTLLATLLDLYRRRQGKPLVGEKSPVHQCYLPELVRWYPRARFVLVVRDGRDNLDSLDKVSWWTKNRFWTACEITHRDRLARRVLRKYPVRGLVVRFEDLLTDPRGTLQGVMMFLGLRFEETQLTPVDSTIVPDWEQAWKGKVNSVLDPERAFAWRRDPAPDVAVVTCLMTSALRSHRYSAADRPGWRHRYAPFTRTAVHHRTDGTYHHPGRRHQAGTASGCLGQATSDA